MSQYRGTQFFSITLCRLLLLTPCNKPPGNFEGIQRNISNAVNVVDGDVTKNVKLALDSDIAINGFDRTCWFGCRCYDYGCGRVRVRQLSV
jgi:hyperosmotically inducible protein